MRTTYLKHCIMSFLQILGMALSGIVISISVKAQETYPVTLEKVMELAVANNLTIQEFGLKYEQALAEQSKAKEWWLPDIYGGFTTHYLSGAAMNTDGTILSGFSRDNLWGGLGIAAEIDFGKGIYQNLVARQKANAVNYFSTAERDKAILSAIQTYYDLQAAQLQYSFLQHLANQSDSLAQQIKIQVDAGLMYQSEYLLSQSNSQPLKITMLQAKSEWQKKSAQLANQLNLDNNVSLVSADTTLVPVSLSIEQSSETGFEKRPEYQGLQAGLESVQTLRKTDNQGLFIPKLKVGFDNGAFGSYSTPLYNTAQLNASLLWNLPLGRLTYNGNLKKHDAKIALQQNKMEQFKNQYQQELSMANSQVQIAGEQMKIGKEALLLASQALNQSIERQKSGTARAFEVFQAQQFFLQAQLDYLNAVSAFNKAQFALKVAKGENL